MDQDVKGNKNENENEEVQDRTDESKEEQAKFKCDMCEYASNKKVTLKKHVNTKHGTN